MTKDSPTLQLPWVEYALGTCIVNYWYTKAPCGNSICMLLPGNGPRPCVS